MRGKVCKELRRIAKFNPHDKREYKEWKLPRKRYIWQVDKDNNTKLVTRVVDCLLIECVDGRRKVYQHLKRYYKGFVEEQELNVLPDDEILKGIQQDAANDATDQQKEAHNGRRKTKIPANSGRTISSKNE